MSIRGASTYLGIGLAVCLIACEKGTTLADDGGPDASFDAGPDAGVDAGPDAGPDAGTALDYAAVDFDTGDAVSLAALRGGPVLLVSWNSTCTSCADDLTGMEAFWLAHQRQNLTIVAVNVDASGDHAAAATERQAVGLTMPVWSDPADLFSSVFGAPFGASGIPATVLIDSEGQLVHLFQGPLSPDDPTFLSLLTAQAVPLQSGTPCGAAETGGTTCLLVIEGRVTDTAGSPLSGATLTYCGVTTCYLGSLDDAGGFRVELGVVLDPTQYALIVHGGLTAAGIYEQLPTPTGSVVKLAAPVVTPLLPQTGPPLPLHATAPLDVTSGGVDLHISAGTRFTVPLDDLVAGDAGPSFVVAAVDPSAAPAFAPASAGLLALYALGPCDASWSAPVGVTVPNSTGLPPGQAVEFLVLDDDLNTLPFAAGTLRVAAQGSVSADGGFIFTDPDAGISVLTWLGVRLAGG